MPSYLVDEAKTYWQRHSKPLQDAGMLTERDVESFALLCQIWGLLTEAKPADDGKERVWFIGLTKQYQSLAKQFGLLPKDRKRSGCEPEQDITDVLRDTLA